MTVLQILTYALVSTWSLVSSGWDHVKRKMHHCCGIKMKLGGKWWICGKNVWMTKMKLWDKDKATGVNDEVVGKSRFCSQRSHCLIFTRPSSRLLGNSLNKKHKTTDIIVWIKSQDIISRRKDNFVKLWIKWVRAW